MPSSRLAYLLAVGLLFWPPVHARGEKAEGDTIDPAQPRAMPLCVTDGWAVWQTSELIERTGGRVAQSHLYRIYRQRLVEPKATLAATFSDTEGPRLASVTPDGTVLLFRRSRLSCYRPDGTEKVYREYLPVVAIYPDGVVLHNNLGGYVERQMAPVFFVPLRNGELDIERQSQVVPGFVPPQPDKSALGNRYSERKELRRHAEVLVWVGEGRLEVFDLRDGKRSYTPLACKVPPFHPVSAFDGETVVLGRAAYDVKTGQAIGPPPEHRGVVFAVRHRIGYYFDGSHLMAVNLTSSAAPQKLIETQPGPVAETDAGLILWDGRKWNTVPWLKAQTQ